MKEGVVRYFGNRTNGGGTTIKVIITRGKNYRTPKEIADAEEDKK